MNSNDRIRFKNVRYHPTGHPILYELNAGLVVSMDGLLLRQAGDGKVVIGNFYIGARNTAQLLIAKDITRSFVVPDGSGYCFDTWECIAVEEIGDTEIAKHSFPDLADDKMILVNGRLYQKAKKENVEQGDLYVNKINPGVFTAHRVNDDFRFVACDPDPDKRYDHFMEDCIAVEEVLVNKYTHGKR